jgi:hypothetical protein
LAAVCVRLDHGSGLCLFIFRGITDEATSWAASRRYEVPEANRLSSKLTLRLPPPGSSYNEPPKLQYILGKDTIGGRIQLSDQVDSGSWVIATHGGFLTPPHHDAEGLCTFMIVSCGAKIWAILDPDSIPRAKEAGDKGAHRQTREGLWVEMDKIFEPETNQEGLDHVTSTIVLEPGDVLCVENPFFYFI